MVVHIVAHMPHTARLAPSPNSPQGLWITVFGVSRGGALAYRDSRAGPSPNDVGPAL